MDEETVRGAVAAMMPQVRADLEGLVRIPSVSFQGFPAQPLRQAAEATRELLMSVGAADSRFLELPDGRPPAVVGSIAGPPNAPTVLLYAHYDVQPVGDEDAWVTPPFEPVERDGRLYGRGSADDKGGLAMHAAALRVFGDAPPLNVRFIVEGEEETGESGLDAVVAARPALFEADAVVVADMGNAEIGIPTLTTSLRGVTSVVVEVRTLQGEVHSGLFGGPAPDALMALVHVLASLHDETGDCAIAGLAGSDWEGADQDEREFRRLAGVEDEVALTGSGSVGTRLWSRPSVNVIGIDAPRIHASRNVLVDVARARVSLRLPPEQDPAEAQRLLIAHLEAAAPWNVRLTITPMETGPGISVSTEGPAHEAMRSAMTTAFGRDATQMGSGGSIPLIHALAETFPGAEILMFGAEEPRTNIHAPNESVDLGELERLIVTEALFLDRFAGPGLEGRRTLEA